MAQKLNRENPLAVDEYLDETEVQTRMSWVLHQFRLFGLHNLDLDAQFDTIGIDSLE